MSETIYSVQGVEAMQGVLDSWTTDKMVDWLHEGFACLADESRYVQWHAAFTPLHFHPQGDERAQFAAALYEAKRAGLSWPEKLARAARERIRNPRKGDSESVAQLADLWSCIEALGLEQADVPFARMLLNHLDKLPGYERDSARELALRIAAAVSTIPRSGQQYQFFVNRLRGSRFWDDTMVVPYAYTQMRPGEDLTPEAAWNDLRHFFAEPLQRVADPATPAGRTFITALMRWLFPQEMTPRKRLSREEAEEQLPRLRLQQPTRLDAGKEADQAAPKMALAEQVDVGSLSYRVARSRPPPDFTALHQQCDQ